MVTGHPEPTADQSDAHDDVADGRHHEVAVLDRLVHATSDHERAGHLYQGEQPVGDVVGVVGRREPREVHPGPPHGEEHAGEADHTVQQVAFDEFMVEGFGRPAHTDDEREIEEQLERRRRAVILVAVAHDGATAQPAEVDGRSATHRPIVPMTFRTWDRRTVACSTS